MLSYIHTYIYIDRERERDRDTDTDTDTQTEGNRDGQRQIEEIWTLGKELSPLENGMKGSLLKYRYFSDSNGTWRELEITIAETF